MIQNYGHSELLSALELTSGATNGTAADLAAVVASQHNEFIGAGPGGREFKAILNVGAFAGTTPTLDVKIQHSADGSTDWTDITGAAFTQVLETVAREEIHFVAPRQWVRAVATLAGTSPVYTLAVILIGQERYS